MIRLLRLTRAAAVLIIWGAAQVASSQNIVDWNVPSGDWNNDLNWLGPAGEFKPESQFDEVANISNGGTATISSAVPAPGNIILGRLQGETGTVIIANAGSVAAVPSTNTAGQIWVGGDGHGTLTMMAGSSLAGESLVVGGELGTSSVSTFSVGEATGASANVTITGSTIASHNIKIIGPNVNFSTNSLSLFSTSTFTPQISSATHSAIQVATSVTLDNGILRPEFSNGVTPSIGDTWNLFDATTINGQFNLDASAAPALPTGQVYRFAAVPDATSTNGVYGQLSVEQLLTLNVDRNTGAISIVNGPSPVSIDGYSIRSNLGGLNPSGWNSLQDQNNSNWRESPQGGSANALSELKPTGSTTVTQAGPLALGSVFHLPTPTEFGTELEDITFEYYSAAGGVTQGLVHYTGNKQYNNLVLVVDPNTGQARLENESTITVNIDGYKIESDSGSLLSANGQWNSLDDQNAAGGDWRESNPSANLLAELKPTASTTMNGGSNFGFDLGTLFKTVSAGGTEDLTFQYLFPGDVEFRDGVVVYRALDNADFNGDHTVNGSDLTIWTNAYGASAGGDADGDGDTDGRDFLIWQRQFGNSSSTATVTSVPEPGSLSLVACMACLFSVATFRGVY